MGVIEQVQAVGLQGDQAGQFQLEAGRGLPGMAITEVDAHRAKPKVRAASTSDSMGAGS
jgi:hypothetical protein